MTVKVMNLTISGGGHAAEYNAPVGQQQEFLVAAGAPVLACWYTPIDNLSDINGFHTIAVHPSGTNVSLTITPSRDALLRILVYVMS